MYVYGEVPPEATTLADPLFAPLQSTFDGVVVAVSAVGCVIVTDFTTKQFLASLTVTE